MKYNIPVTIQVIVKIAGRGAENVDDDAPNTLAEAREQVREYLDDVIKSNPRFGGYSITITGEGHA